MAGMQLANPHDRSDRNGHFAGCRAWTGLYHRNFQRRKRQRGKSMKERLFRRISPERLEELLEIVGRKSIAVIGDFCLDVYWTLNMSASEISLETGKRTQPVKNQRYSPGGAGNVVANLFDLGAGNVSSFGATGSDPFGEKMRTLLGHLSDCSSLMTCETEEYQTLTYIKPYDGREELGRLDVGNFNSLPDCLALELISSLESRLAGFDMVM